jgi:SAM-dependent methyltransferase
MSNPEEVLPTQSNEALPTNQLLTDPNAIKLILAERLKRMVGIKGELFFPCLPSCQDEYLKFLKDLLRLLGQNVTEEQEQNLQQLLNRCIAEGYRVSRNSRVVLSFFPANAQNGLAGGITFNAQVQSESVIDKYQAWPTIRQEPLFGIYPDSKVMAVAAQLGDPTKAKILDVGAGPGRNSLPLARLGHPIEAVELTPVFAEKLEAAAAAENLSIKIIKGDVLDPLLRLGAIRYKMVIATELVTDFRHVEQARLFLARMSDALVSGGMLLFSVFMAADGYEPDESVRQMSEFCWSFTMTKNDLDSAMEDLPLELISNESVIEYEQKNLPADGWPPTTWFPSWASGRDVFPIQQTPPIELRWLLMKKV